MESPNRHPLKGYIEGHLKKQAGLEKFVKNEKTFYLQCTGQKKDGNIIYWFLRVGGKKSSEKLFRKPIKVTY